MSDGQHTPPSEPPPRAPSRPRNPTLAPAHRRRRGAPPPGGGPPFTTPPTHFRSAPPALRRPLYSTVLGSPAALGPALRSAASVRPPPGRPGSAAPAGGTTQGPPPGPPRLAPSSAQGRRRPPPAHLSVNTGPPPGRLRLRVGADARAAAGRLRSRVRGRRRGARVISAPTTGPHPARRLGPHGWSCWRRLAPSPRRPGRHRLLLSTPTGGWQPGRLRALAPAPSPATRRVLRPATRLCGSSWPAGDSLGAPPFTSSAHDGQPAGHHAATLLGSARSAWSRGAVSGQPAPGLGLGSGVSGKDKLLQFLAPPTWPCGRADRAVALVVLSGRARMTSPTARRPATCSSWPPPSPPSSACCRVRAITDLTWPPVAAFKIGASSTACKPPWSRRGSAVGSGQAALGSPETVLFRELLCDAGEFAKVAREPRMRGQVAQRSELAASCEPAYLPGRRDPRRWAVAPGGGCVSVRTGRPVVPSTWRDPADPAPAWGRLRRGRPRDVGAPFGRADETPSPGARIEAAMPRFAVSRPRLVDPLGGPPTTKRHH